MFEVYKISRTENLNKRGSSMDNEMMMVRIFDTDITAKEYRGKMVVTFKDIDLCHKRPDGTARKRFNDNKTHFIEGVDFFIVDLTTSEIRTQFGAGKNAGKTMYVMTESGYLMIVKSFTDDLAWKVQRMLVNSYFKMKKLEEVAMEQYEQIEKQNQAIELYKSLILVLSDKASIFYDNVRNIINDEMGKLNLPPTTPNQKAMNTWKKYNVNSNMLMLSEKLGIDIQKCYSMMYDKMKMKFGFDESFARMEFLQKYPDVTGVSTIDLIAEDKIYQSWFIDVFNKWSADIGLFTKNSTDSDDTHEKVTEYSTITFTMNDDVDDMIICIAEIRNDTTVHKNATRSLIYSRMNTDRGWKVAMTRNHCATKIALIKKCPNQKKRFIKVCNELVNNGIL